MSKTTEMLKSYVPYNKQERSDLEQIFKAEEVFGDILSRENKFCHMTAGAFIVNKEHTKVLCVFHNIFKTWACVGGHADGDDDMLYVAKKETKEETSLKNFVVVGDRPISVEILPIKSHERKGEYVPAHVQLNVFYLFETDENEAVQICEDENSNIGWLEFDQFLSVCEDYMKPVYEKIIERIGNIS